MGYGNGVAGVALGVDPDVHLSGENLKLIDSCRTVEVCRDQKGCLTVLLEMPRDLGGGSGLASTVEANHQDGVGLARAMVEPVRAATENLRKLFVGNPDDLLARCQALEQAFLQNAVSDTFDEIAGHPEVDIRFQQRHPHLSEGRVDVLLSQSPLVSQAVEHTGEFFRQNFKHILLLNKRTDHVRSARGN